MDELVKLVSEKTGLDKKQAKVAVEIVVDYLKKKLPAPIGSQIDGLLSGKSELGAAANLIGGLLDKGKKG
jgi:hypothetical protein